MRIFEAKTEKKSFRLSKENLDFLQAIKEKMDAKSLNEVVDVLLDFLQNGHKDLSMIFRSPKSTDNEISDKKITIFINQKELETLKKQAKQNGFSTTNKFAKFLILNHLYDERILSNDTINEFARTNNLIKRIGINLSLFVRSIQQDSSAYFVKDDLSKLAQQIENQAKETEKFLLEQKKILRVKLR